MNHFAKTASGGGAAICAQKLYGIRLLRRFPLGLCGVLLLSTSLLSSLLPMRAQAQVNVLTARNDIARTGQNVNETILTHSNVNPTQFGRLFQHSINGWVLGQPLYVQQVPIAGAGTHNVVYVTDWNDDVYAFDADTNGGANGNALWQVSLLTNSTSPGTLTLGSGVWGTPVIDLSTNTMYVVSSEYQGSNAIFRLHALDITSGAEKFGGPVVIQGSVAGTGNGSVGGVLTFEAAYARQRPALLLLNGVVYMAFGSHNDEGPYHGWLFSYDVNQSTHTLEQLDIFCTAPNGSEGGVWMGGSGLAGEVYNANKPYGRLFVSIANGTYSTATQPYSYGMSVLDMDLTGGQFTVEDIFTPHNAVSLSNSDADLGSSGPLLLPTQTLASGKLLNPLLQIGKSGMFYLLDRDNNADGSNDTGTEYSPAGLGGFHTGSDKIVQEVQTPVTAGSSWGSGVWGSNAYFNGNVYSGGTTAAGNGVAGQTLKAYSLVNGVLANVATGHSIETYVYPGPNPSISANGVNNGIVWVLGSVPLASGATDLVLRAYDAKNLGRTLYSSDTNLSRDDAGHAEIYAVPTVANGKVFVGASGRLDVYGLLDAPTSPSPVISPGSSTFSGQQTVTITDAQPGATIYYSTSGAIPTVNSAVYSAATGITISTSTTINAIASANGYIASAPATASYVSTTSPPAPSLSLAAGTYIGTQSLTITDGSTAATVYYTVNGSTPSPGASGTLVYSGPVAVSASETVTAMAVNPGPYSGASVGAAYVIEPAGTIDFTNGFTNANGPMSFNGSTDLDDFRLQLTNGGLNEAGSAFYATPVNIQSFQTSFTLQLSNPVADGMTFTIQNVGASALGAVGGGLGYQGIGQSVAIKFDLHNNAGEGSDSTGLYKNGASPTQPSVNLTGTGIDLHSGDYIDVALTYDGSTLSMTLTDEVTEATWSTTFAINIPAVVGGNTAYVGFTAGTGATSASLKVSSWLYLPQ